MAQLSWFIFKRYRDWRNGCGLKKRKNRRKVKPVSASCTMASQSSCSSRWTRSCTRWKVEELPDGTKFSALNSIDLKEISHIAQWLDKNDIGPSIDVQRTEEGDTPLQAKLKRLRAQAKGGRNDEEPPSVLEG